MKRRRGFRPILGNAEAGRARRRDLVQQLDIIEAAKAWAAERDRQRDLRRKKELTAGRGTA